MTRRPRTRGFWLSLVSPLLQFGQPLPRLRFILPFSPPSPPLPPHPRPAPRPLRRAFPSPASNPSPVLLPPPPNPLLLLLLLGRASPSPSRRRFLGPGHAPLAVRVWPPTAPPESALPSSPFGKAWTHPTSSPTRDAAAAPAPTQATSPSRRAPTLSRYAFPLQTLAPPSPQLVVLCYDDDVGFSTASVSPASRCLQLLVDFLHMPPDFGSVLRDSLSMSQRLLSSLGFPVMLPLVFLGVHTSSWVPNYWSVMAFASRDLSFIPLFPPLGRIR